MFSEFLRERRKTKNLTQEQAAEQIGVHPVTLSGWERGTKPSWDAMTKIADWAGVTLDELRTIVEGAA